VVPGKEGSTDAGPGRTVTGPVDSRDAVQKLAVRGFDLLETIRSNWNLSLIRPLPPPVSMLLGELVKEDIDVLVPFFDDAVEAAKHRRQR
jgi:hypothetical protein